MKIDVKDQCMQGLNQQIRAAVRAGEKDFEILNANGQRYIGDGIIADESVRIKIHGVAGNDLAAFMSGPVIEVFGNAQDAAANTLNAGKVIIHGSTGDLLGYGMRGGKVFVRDNVGYRVGVHMKSFKDTVPVIVVGGFAGSFFGEYMAGGILILLGLNKKKADLIAGDYLATGMHGGAIYLRGEMPQNMLGKEVAVRELDDDDEKILETNIKEFSKHFEIDYDRIRKEKFTKLLPVNKRPYGQLYYGFKPVKTLG
jgi:glutamate synthase domain-containing protein 3